MSKPPETVREQIACCYANLARVHAALGRGDHAYRRIDHMIRAKLERRLLDGTMQMRSLYDDERIKMTAAQACYYCGDAENLCAVGRGGLRCGRLDGAGGAHVGEEGAPCPAV